MSCKDSLREWSLTRNPHGSDLQKGKPPTAPAKGHQVPYLHFPWELGPFPHLKQLKTERVAPQPVLPRHPALLPWPRDWRDFSIWCGVFRVTAPRRRLCSAERHVWLSEAPDYGSALLLELLVINFTALCCVLQHEAAQVPTSAAVLGPNKCFVIPDGEARNRSSHQQLASADLQQRHVQTPPSLSGAKGSVLSKFTH